MLAESSYVRRGRPSPASRSPGLVDPRKALRAVRRGRDDRLPGPAPLPPAADRPGRASSSSSSATPARPTPTSRRRARRASRCTATATTSSSSRPTAPSSGRYTTRAANVRAVTSRTVIEGDCRIDDVLLRARPVDVPADRHPPRRPGPGRRQPPRHDRHQPADLARPGPPDRRPPARRGRRAAPAGRLGRPRRRARARPGRPAPGPGPRARDGRPVRRRRPRRPSGS